MYSAATEIIVSGRYLNLGSIFVNMGRLGMKFRVVLEPAEEGGYTVYVPNLPGCISEGDGVDEALKKYPGGY